MLDVISTASLVLDVPWVTDAMQGGREEEADEVAHGKTARIGAKATRMVRVVLGKLEAGNKGLLRAPLEETGRH